MKIETKFDINNLVQHKFNKCTSLENGDVVCAYEVMDITTNTCYAGTQIFYDLRPIHKIFFTSGYADKKKTSIDIGTGYTKFQNGWIRYREDELIAAKQSDIDLILGIEG